MFSVNVIVQEDLMTFPLPLCRQVHHTLLPSPLEGERPAPFYPSPVEGKGNAHSRFRGNDTAATWHQLAILEHFALFAYKASLRD